ncbi:hypothetical protein H696_06118 [Fonticula alba]|uniref:Uncharacterized protein n=1 Tax=Fonticula alba TaxID=691883 RepID=A0A058YZY1_FONAL|nr:hypothetical protein H696_06118 [Fonticula alba]KCV67426.1 hypothetical protein H696_06118 [Fonticula alba]|eukprot:XP_009498153.1 hypothetical protein H696_06118 [Fonticula alba]
MSACSGDAEAAGPRPCVPATGEAPAPAAQKPPAVALTTACFAVSLARPAGSPRVVPYAAVANAALGACSGGESLLQVSQTLHLAIGSVELALLVTDLRVDGASLPDGAIDKSTQVILAAGPEVQLLDAPVVVSLSGLLGHAPEQHVILNAMHLSLGSLDVLFAPAGGQVARALAAHRPDAPEGPFYARHQERVFHIRICHRPTVPGLALRASPRLFSSLGLRQHGRPMPLVVCDPPPVLGVVWLETDEPFEQHDQARVQRELAGAPLHAGHVSCLAGTARTGARPADGPGDTRRWLLLESPPAGEAGRPLCLEAEASPLRAFPAGRAAISPALHQKLRRELSHSSDLFLRWGDHLLLLCPDPNPRTALTEGQVTLGQGDFNRIFAHHTILQAGVLTSPPRVFQVELHLLAAGLRAERVAHRPAEEAFLRQFDRSVLSQGQVCQLQAEGMALRVQVAQLLGADLQPLHAGYLDMATVVAFLHISDPKQKIHVADRPASALVQVARLEEPLRLPLVAQDGFEHPDQHVIHVTGGTFEALQRHFLHPGRTLFVGPNYRLETQPTDYPKLKLHQVLVDESLYRMRGDGLFLRYVRPPALLVIKCIVEPSGEDSPPVIGPRVLERLFLRSIPPSGVVWAKQQCAMPPDLPGLSMSLTWMRDLADRPAMVGTYVPGVTRLSFGAHGVQLDPKPAHLLALGCGRQLVALDALFTRTPSALYPGLLLPREVFQSAAEARNEARPPECLFFQCRGRVFMARLADTHHVSGVVRVCEDLRESMYPGLAPMSYLQPAPGASYLGTVHLRVTPADAASARPVAADMTEEDLRRALGLVFSDGSMATMERRVLRGLALKPELLLDPLEQTVACGLFHPGRTQVHLHLRDVVLLLPPPRPGAPEGGGPADAQPDGGPARSPPAPRRGAARAPRRRLRLGSRAPSD